LPEFKNPNQAGGRQDNGSFLILIVVMFVVIIGAQWWMQKNRPKAPETSAPAVTQTAAAPAAPLGSVETPVAAMTADAPATPEVKATAESTTVVENELYRVTFSNKGGAVTSWILKNFKDIEGKPLDMVHEGGAKNFGYPLSLYTYDPAITSGLANAMFVPSATGKLEAPATLKFDYSAGNITVHKTFTFGADYVIHADAVVLRDGQPIRALLSWPANMGDMETLQSYGNATIDMSTNGKDDHLNVKNAVGGATLNGPFDFAGASDQYFAAIFMPDQPQDATVATLHNQLMTQFKGSASTPMPRSQAFGPLPADGKAPTGWISLPFLGAAVGNLSGHDQVRLFVGPKSLKVLKSIHAADGSTLQTVLDFGFWSPIAKPLFLGLQLVHAHIASNWGWAIIIFTVFINLVVLPLRVQGMRSMLKMQRIQPEVDKIKAKYGNPKPTDPKTAEMNAEVMAYQKTQGVSMFGGCIPTLIQFPLLIAFFYMMVRVVELRQAHWYWLHDLSQPDPYHILPVLMVITSFLAQYFTPSPGVDPAQQKMMAFMMPAFSGWMTWQYASGLALYWNVGNLIMIIQQQVMNRTSLGREMKEIAAKRAKTKTLGKTGGAKTIQGRR
jgi:YidC/Oxa1 family membrane protein insertase